MSNQKTTATVAANAKTEKNSDTEKVIVTNSGDKPTEGSISDAGNAPANIAPATEVDPSGAPVQIVPDVDLKHPAVDDNPRAGTTVNQNKIDFNDPTKDGSEAVADMLNAQGVPTTTETAKDEK